MKALIVGGNLKIGAPSTIVTKIAGHLSESGLDTTEINGEAPDMDFRGYDLIIWMPEYSNDAPKTYPKKDQGAVLICSKVIRKETTPAQALERVFAMHGNAVIMIHKENPRVASFQLMDALGNSKEASPSIGELTKNIIQIALWTKSSIRQSLVKSDFLAMNPVGHTAKYTAELQQFIDMIKMYALKAATQCGNRAFGNYSTRCTKLFPSTNIGKMYMFSPRNIDKRFITINDLVLVTDMYYFGDRKPSVDSPVQIELYKHNPGIGYMIHGHAYCDHPLSQTTRAYFPCGDLREAEIVKPLIKDSPNNVINLKNHGFLITACGINNVMEFYNESTFRPL